MTRLWWVRHGPTHQPGLCGWTDVPADLSDRDKIERLQSALPAEAPVISSDLIRTRTTADAIAGTRIRLPDAPALREFHFGAWERLTFDEISARDPDLSRAYWDAPGDIAPPGGESWNRAAARINSGIDALLDAHPGRDLILVAHVGVILTQYARAAGLAPAEALAQQIENLSLTRIAIGPDSWQVECINHHP